MNVSPDWNTLIKSYTAIQEQHPLDRRPDLWICGYIPESEILARFLGDRPSRVLDYGCGNGRVSRFLRGRCGYNVTGLDVNPEAIRRARTFPDDVTYHLIEPNKIPVALTPFDGCVCNHVFPTYAALSEIRITLTAIAAALRPNAPLLVYVDNTNYAGIPYCSFMGGEPGHTYKSGDSFPMRIYLDGTIVMEFEDFYWKPQDYLEVVESAGFLNVTVTYPVPSMAAIDVYEKYFGVKLATELTTERKFPPAAIYCGTKPV